MTSEIYNALLALYKNLSRRKPKTYVVSIDDLLHVLRLFRALGYRCQRDPDRIVVDGRQRKKSIWLIRSPFDDVVDSLYVDATRSLPHGNILMFKPPELRITPGPNPYEHLDNILFGQLYRGGWDNKQYVPPTND